MKKWLITIHQKDLEKARIVNAYQDVSYWLEQNVNPENIEYHLQTKVMVVMNFYLLREEDVNLFRFMFQEDYLVRIREISNDELTG